MRRYLLLLFVQALRLAFAGRKLWCSGLLLLFSFGAIARDDTPIKIFTSDIPLFWNAYDQAILATDTVAQAAIMQHLYLDKAGDGVKSMIEVRELSAMDWVRSINKYPGFWKSIRNKTLQVQDQVQNIEALMKRFKELYPSFRQPMVYYIVGNIKTGGVTLHDRILMGTEIITADSTINTAGLSPFIKEVFRLHQGIDYLTMHEAVHTQQKGIDDPGDSSSNLLGYCIREGACDFIAELLLQKPVITPYMTYGQAHEAELWQKFKLAMYAKETKDWLYNGGTTQKGLADLGYFMGYKICKAYYNQARDKQQAIQEIIEIDYNDLDYLQQFLEKSGYNP